MDRIRKTVHVEAPPERVWEVLFDAERLPEWNEELLAVKDVSGAESRGVGGCGGSRPGRHDYR